MKKIVIIGGGTGTSTIVSGLKKLPYKLSVIVSSADNGGSTGRIRKELNVMPPGDLRQCLIALSDAPENIKDLFKDRFDTGVLKGHSMGNLIISTFEKITGSPEKAIKELGGILKLKGEVMFSSEKPTTLSAIYEDGTKIIGEHEIGQPKKNHGKIIKISLSKNKPNKEALRSIRESDLIILGPGDLYASILPNILVEGISKAISNSKAKKVFVSNIMTKYGQTDKFKASDFVDIINTYLKTTKIDIVILNSDAPSKEILDLYKKEKAEFVEPDIQTIESKKIKVISEKLFSDTPYKKPKGDKLRRSLLRHDSEKISEIISKILK